VRRNQAIKTGEVITAFFVKTFLTEREKMLIGLTVAMMRLCDP